MTHGYRRNASDLRLWGLGEGDAIRDAQLQRVVRYAAILCPGPEVRYADQVEALQVYPGNDEQLWSRLREVLVVDQLDLAAFCGFWD